MTVSTGPKWFLTQITQNLPSKDLIFAGGKFVAVGNGIYYSNDGISWTATANQSGQYSAITYGNGQFVAMDVNQNNNNEPVLSISTDGVQWEQEKYEFPEGLKSSNSGGSGVSIEDLNLVYGNGRFVLTASARYGCRVGCSHTPATDGNGPTSTRKSLYHQHLIAAENQ